MDLLSTINKALSIIFPVLTVTHLCGLHTCLNVVLYLVSVQVATHPATVHGNAALPVSAPQPTGLDELLSLTDHQDPPPTDVSVEKDKNVMQKTSLQSGYNI